VTLRLTKPNSLRIAALIAPKQASNNKRIQMIVGAMGCQLTDFIIDSLVDSIDLEGDEIDRSQIAL
jgi:hypothetical protein